MGVAVNSAWYSLSSKSAYSHTPSTYNFIEYCVYRQHVSPTVTTHSLSSFKHILKSTDHLSKTFTMRYTVSACLIALASAGAISYSKSSLPQVHEIVQL